jgi:hypothetical protein
MNDLTKPHLNQHALARYCSQATRYCFQAISDLATCARTFSFLTTSTPTTSTKIFRCGNIQRLVPARDRPGQFGTASARRPPRRRLQDYQSLSVGSFARCSPIAPVQAELPHFCARKFCQPTPPQRSRVCIGERDPAIPERENQNPQTK